MELIKPMLAKSAHLPNDDSQYGFEIKWDGIRAIIYLDNNSVRILSRNLLDITHQYPELQQLIQALEGHSVVLDGEIVAFTPDGKPSFELLQSRMGLISRKTIEHRSFHLPVTYIIFDLLAFDGNNLMNESYTRRREMLQKLNLQGPNWQTPSYTQGNGHAILETSRRLGLEGIIAKRLTSIYIPGKRTGDWLKIKNQLRQELIIAGWVPGKGKRSGRIGALLVGVYDISAENAANYGQQQHLLYAGKVGTGFTCEMLDKLEESLQILKIDQNPFFSKVPVKEAIFVKPVLVGEFEFTEWTTNHTLRHPSFKGIRIDKDPCSVVRET